MMSWFHSTAMNQVNYVGFSSLFHPSLLGSNVADAYDVSKWDGITFRAKTGGAPATQPVFVEVLTKDTQPGPPDAGGTATVATIDKYNNRGFIATVDSTAKQFFVPFAALIPRSMPAASACPAASATTVKCQAPAFVPTNALGIQFSFYGPSVTMGTPGLPTNSVMGNYNMLIDDVAFYKRSALPAGVTDLPALPSSGGAHPLQESPTINARCTKPVRANAKMLGVAYDNWKTKFVTAAGGGLRVRSPEMNDVSVSEGIAYGMLIAVYMDDKALFDGLWTYWKSNGATSDGPLMTWEVPGGSGTATDADEDAAFAMLMASKQWSGGTYAADAMNLMHAVLAHDMSGSYIKGGSNYSNGGVTNPSYFAPAWYRAFARADAANASAWNGLASGAYTLLNAAVTGISPTYGLLSAWCSGGSCSSTATNTGSANPAEDVIYQYDSHRIPYRIGIDYCWNGTAAAKSYVDKTSAFFASPSRGGGGVGRIYDKYNPNGTDYSAGGMMGALNSASIIGTSAVGAMANSTYATYVNDSYQLVLDLLNRGPIGDKAGMLTNPPTKSAYSYYNATVGMLMLLTMSGNLQDWTQ